MCYTNPVDIVAVNCCLTTDETVKGICALSLVANDLATYFRTLSTGNTAEEHPGSSRFLAHNV